MKQLANYIPTVLVAALIAYLSLLRELSLKIPQFVIDIPYFDKIVHFGMYFCLTATIYFDTKRSQYKKRETLYIVSTLIPIFYGGIIEILQEKFFYPRTGDWLDWLADTIGTIVCICIIYVTLTIKQHK